MIEARMEWTPSPIERASAVPLYAASQPEHTYITFAAAMASARERSPAFSPGATGATTASSSGGSTLSASASASTSTSGLARHLDALARHRVEAQALSDDIAGAWATRPDMSTLAVTMHRQARAMASYNMGVMWSAKLVGATAGALRQLATAA